MNEDIQAEFQPLPTNLLEPMQTRRAEADEAIDVAHMGRWLQAFVEEKAHEYQ
ncbi:hypothetical protein [Achromobacter sp. UMC46]|uniref:hypothetical protein n=1 Tax=Achromobacter sp. UMC46 TaxID=1862319 RepID=UPI0016014A47|nr:hypothetical protein [Achromobacter sp. UMC46]